MILDFTTTAVARPKIVDRTYASFHKNLKGIEFDKCTLYINIDPLPASVDRNKVIKVAEKYFGKVVANTPEQGNYTQAYNWCWSSAQTEYIFNLEDDWTLKEEVNVDRIMRFFDAHKNLFEVALRAYPYVYQKCPTSPAFLHERFYKKVGGNLDPTLNPETQLRGKKFGIKMPCKAENISHEGKVCVYPKNVKKVILKDIGREWIESSKFKRPPKKARFTTWVTK
jgi:hypothetical protein